jgi:hypothetical protein
MLGAAMTDQTFQLALSASVPTIAVLLGILINNSRLNDLRWYMGARFSAVDRRFDAVDKRFDAVDRRFDDAKDTWRAELHRVEEVIDARLKHLEER